MNTVEINIEYRGHLVSVKSMAAKLNETIRQVRLAIDDHIDQTESRTFAEIEDDDTLPKLPRYRSHKVVHAVEMSAGEYMDYQASHIGGKPKAIPQHGQARDAAGYLVIYNRDTADHYESWSPADVFDAGYTRID